MPRLLITTLLACFLTGIVWGAFPGEVQAQKAPKFWITNFERKRFDSRKHEGSIVLSFFFVDCVPCIKEIPQLHKMITTEYPDAALLFVDPIGEDSPEYIKEFAERLGVPIPLFYHDPLGRLAKKFFKGRFVFPTIVGMRAGSILFRVNDLGPESLAKIEGALR